VNISKNIVIKIKIKLFYQVFELSTIIMKREMRGAGREGDWERQEEREEG
jgi:hypothetical protein